MFYQGLNNTIFEIIVPTNTWEMLQKAFNGVDMVKILHLQVL